LLVTALPFFQNAKHYVQGRGLRGDHGAHAAQPVEMVHGPARGFVQPEGNVMDRQNQLKHATMESVFVSGTIVFLARTPSGVARLSAARGRP